MEDNRRHPDVFTEAEALAYLHMPPTGARTMETLRRDHKLSGFMVGREMMYHRRHLDALVVRLAGIDVEADTEARDQGGQRAMKIGGRK